MPKLPDMSAAAVTKREALSKVAKAAKANAKEVVPAPPKPRIAKRR